MENKSKANTFKYFNELSEHTSKAIFAYHVESNEFSYLNSSFEQIWNKSLESAKSKPASLLETVHPEDKDFIINSYKQLLKGKKKEEVEFRILLNEEHIRWLCLKAHS